jgi:hypothetical protein
MERAAKIIEAVVYDPNPLEPNRKTGETPSEKVPVAVLALGAAFVASLLVGLNVG